ncbi:MAG TPA: hypothetical protein VFA81_10815 [Burkholderiales bacterium]|nr:hypothetical protein [Burkholderiales bacterium]
MLEIVGKDGVIYYCRPYCPASRVDKDERDLSDVERRLADVLKDAPGLKRPPRVILDR